MNKYKNAYELRNQAQELQFLDVAINEKNPLLISVRCAETNCSYSIELDTQSINDIRKAMQDLRSRRILEYKRLAKEIADDC